jgi:thaumatin family protein
MRAIAAVLFTILLGTLPAGGATAAPDPAPAAAAVSDSAASDSADRTITFVNRSGETLWLGSAVNPDGSADLTGLPTLEDGQSADITIPESADPGHWRGKFFARQDCSGDSGSSFHCEVGDCGAEADHCTTGEQPVSLAEFNFDPTWATVGADLVAWFVDLRR